MIALAQMAENVLRTADGREKPRYRINMPPNGVPRALPVKRR